MSIYFYYVPFLLLIDYLRTLFPEINQLRFNLQKLADTVEDLVISDVAGDSSRNNRVFVALIADCLTFLLPRGNIFNDDHMTGDESTKIHYYRGSYRGSDFYIAYRLQEVRDNYVLMRRPTISAITNRPEVNAPVAKANAFGLMVETLDKCLREGIIEA
ncbi:hypothetical protein [Parapedobacter koreensis]|uniref:Uncharacterized protein n=1 Tax=Parapedobacter koreensis TaxID=332977 RepID=A0A1H7UAT2_9SPHI|nr:hypothetical protein [Parapedobacter koreensis]SEL94172.1 hypothetical protein SAMN05421740_11472 [Parapedobacter koreensis]